MVFFLSAAAALGGAAGSDSWLLKGVVPEKELQIKLDDSLLKYYGWPATAWNETSLRDAYHPRPIERHRNLTKDEFARLVARGIPFILEDASDPDWDISSWRCSSFNKEFPNFKFRQEYSLAQIRGDESNLETFSGEADQWWTQKRPNNFNNLPDDAPKYTPFYWDFAKAWESEPERGWLAADGDGGGDMDGGGVAPRQGSQRARVRSAVGRVQGLARLPRCLSEENARETKHSLEFWLQPAESGSAAHIDGHCSSTMAFTFGAPTVQKRWRLQMVPPKPTPLPDAYKDGMVYAGKEWFPQWEGTTAHGEAIVFYPGMLHEGMNVSPIPAAAEDPLDERCIIGMTYQFNTPMATGLYRHFYERFRRLDELRPCRRGVKDLALFGVELPLFADTDVANKHASQRAQEIDADSDGIISKAEVEAYRRKIGGKTKMTAQLPTWQDLVYFHDLNDDGNLDVVEAVENMQKFSVVEALARREEKQRAKKQRKSESRGDL